MVEHILLRFLIKCNDFASTYKMFIYADSGSGYQTELKSGIET